MAHEAAGAGVAVEQDAKAALANRLGIDGCQNQAQVLADRIADLLLLPTWSAATQRMSDA